MKKSVARQLAVMFISLLVLVMVAMLFANNVFLERFYEIRLRSILIRAYTLVDAHIGEDGIIASASTKRGLLNAIYTMQQMLPASFFAKGGFRTLLTNGVPKKDFPAQALSGAGAWKALTFTGKEIKKRESHPLPFLKLLTRIELVTSTLPM